MTASAAPGRVDELTRLRRRLERSKAENEILERMIEDTTRSLYGANEELEESKQQLQRLLTSLSAAVIAIDDTGVISSVAGRTANLTGRDPLDLIGRPIDQILQLADGAEFTDEELSTCEAVLLGADGRSTPVVVSRSSMHRRQEAGVETAETSSGGASEVYTAIDISDRKRLEVELRHAQRLEAVGSLAAGVAHELNTPIQYVMDSVRFIADSIDDLTAIDELHQALRELAHGFDGGADLVAAIEKMEETLDVGFIRGELPGALDRTIGGLRRMSSIVKAMRRFSHPGEDFVLADVNQLVETAVTLAAHEYKYVADLDLQLAELPEVRCNKVDLGGVIVNLLVNASHAIGDRLSGSGKRGHLSITTGIDGDGVRIDVADDGGGIPPEIQDRVFEPFFTTKAPGKGTGQGLALAHNTVVSRHGGRLAFDVVEGVGTTFHIWLPSEGSR